MLTVSQVYSVRFGTRLSLSNVIQDNIAKLRITPAAYKSVRVAARYNPRRNPMAENWRESAITDCVRRVKEYDDPDYSEIFSIFNKLAPATLEKLCKDVVEILNSRDQPFRLRIVTLLFNKAINEFVFANVMALCAKHLAADVPDIKEDLKVQIDMFPKLYNMTETLVFPVSGEEDYDNKIVKWMKQKDIRRGYAKFMTQLFSHDLISEDVIHVSLSQVIEDLNEVAVQPKTPQTEENTTHFVDFLYESGAVLPKGATNIRNLLKDSLTKFLAIPRPELPSLCMRSRFKAEDALKCVR
jgi:hypothetical protein